jgi:hypothetical protein
MSKLSGVSRWGSLADSDSDDEKTFCQGVTVQVSRYWPGLQVASQPECQPAASEWTPSRTVGPPARASAVSLRVIQVAGH